MITDVMKRGDIWLVEVEGDRRLGLVVSADAVLRETNTVAVLPLTEDERPLPTRVRVPPEAGLTPHWIVTEGLRCVSKSRLIARAGVVPADTMRVVSTCLRLLLDLESNAR